eukprot:EG_transcript_14496
MTAPARFATALLLLWWSAVPPTEARPRTPLPVLPGTGNATVRGHPEFIAALSTNTTQVYRWVGQILYSAADWTASPMPRAPSCPNASNTSNASNATTVFCGGRLERHWPHAADWVYNCWYFFDKYRDSLKVLYASGPALGEGVLGKLRVLNVSVTRSLPPPRCGHDVVLRRRPNSIRSGWHHDEPGANFISVASAWSFRRRMLRHLETLNLKPRFSRPPIVTHEPPGERLRIGLLNRHGGRRLVNPQLVYEAFANHSARLELHTLDDMSHLKTFEEQCLWANRMDIIVSSHGAQLSNLVCALPCTVVVEIFPKNYFIPGFFNPFFAALGLETFGIYLGANGFKDADSCNRRTKCRIPSRNVPVEVPAVFRELPPWLFSTWHACCKFPNCNV